MGSQEVGGAEKTGSWAVDLPTPDHPAKGSNAADGASMHALMQLIKPHVTLGEQYRSLMGSI